MLAEIRKELDHNGHALRLMQSISYTKQYDLEKCLIEAQEGLAFHKLRFYI